MPIVYALFAGMLSIGWVLYMNNKLRVQGVSEDVRLFCVWAFSVLTGAAVLFVLMGFRC